jgi:hypothetical protein
MSSSASRTSAQRTTHRHPAQHLALAIGALFTLLAIAGFLQVGLDPFVGPEGEPVLGFEVNGLHNIVHLAVGLMGLAAWRRLDSTRGFGWTLFALYGLTFLYGLAVGGQDTDANLLALNSADNVLHGAAALAGLAIALWPARDRRTDGQHRTLDLTDERSGTLSGQR